MKLKTRFLELGLTEQEIIELGEERTKTYYKFYHNKHYNTSSVLFSKMETTCLSKLQNIANKSNININ